MNDERVLTKANIFSHVSATVLATAFALALCQLEFDGVKGILIDGLFRLRFSARPDPTIQLIAYDDGSSQRYAGSTKIPLEELVSIFDVLAVEKPRAVAVLGAFNEKNYSPDELRKVSEAFQKVPNAMVGYLDDESLGRDGPIELGNAIPYLPGFISRDTFSYGADSVSRRVMFNIDGIPTVYNRLACAFAEQACAPQQYERVGDSLQTYINWQGPPNTYTAIPTEKVVSGNFPKGAFADKLVLISTALNSKKGADHIFTPYSRRPYETTALEGAAHGLSTLARGTGLRKLPSWVNWLIAGFIAALTVNMVLILSPGKGIIFVVSEIVAVLFIAGLCLIFGNLWVDAAHPIVVAFVGYYLVIPYRLVDEYRKRWHYQEKSELMAQLELLKSNFLSLVSHDLKTPIARIQGNAELALNDGKPLSEKQKKSLQAIINTTEDLGQYVETVLDLTRVESAKVPLQIVSKDINAVIREVVAQKSPVAAERDISIEVELEPMFSMKFDAKLIRRVLSNIVENAIKYSPPNTRILLSTREQDNWVRISIADQGFGISAQEQELVFQKFYRCEGHSKEGIKGTGLGLYLVRYFVELHKGIVELKSEVGKGSTFTVSLPVYN